MEISDQEAFALREENARLQYENIRLRMLVRRLRLGRYMTMPPALLQFYYEVRGMNEDEKGVDQP